MEKKNETDVFDQKKQRTEESKFQTVGRTVSSMIAGGAGGVGGAALANVSQKTISLEQEPEPEHDSPVESESDSEANNPSQDVVNPVHDEPIPEPKIPSKPSADPKKATDVNPEPEPEPETNPEPEPEPEPEPPVMPVEEIDPNDNELADIIENVTMVDVVYDINGNPMLVATAHNAIDGEFYLVDVDMDGDFDVVLNTEGVPVVELTDEYDRLITITDIEQKITDDYIGPNEIDISIAQHDMIHEQIQNDITIVDDIKA